MIVLGEQLTDSIICIHSPPSSLWVKVAMNAMDEFLCGAVSSIFSGIYLGGQFLGYMVTLFNILKRCQTEFS